MEEELKKYGLHAEYSEAEDREAIDFEIRDSHDELYATVWGSEPSYDVQIDCNHDIAEYDDDETQGECVLCGATCDWHYEEDDGNVEDYCWKGKTPCIDEWYSPKKIGGIIGKYLKELQERNA